MRKGLLCLIGATVVLLPAPGVLASDAMEAEGLQTERPVVSVVMPLGFGQSAIGYVIGAGSESKLIVALEVTDATGHGIVANDKGIPAFVEPDQNVELFTRYITMVGTIINKAGQSVTQIVAEIPVRKLVPLTGVKVTPPIDWRDASQQHREKGFPIPADSMVDVARFQFRVKDRTGALSNAEAPKSRLNIGLANGVFRMNPELPFVEEADPE